MSAGKRILERYDWWDFAPHQEWVEPSAGPGNFMAPYAAGIAGRVRVVYFPEPLAPWTAPTSVKGLEAGLQYTASYFDPKTGEELLLGPVHADADGSWRVPYPAVMQDWVLVLEVGH